MDSNNKLSGNRFFIIDGYALLFRAHFALIRNPLITTYGLNTSALFGFTNMIFKLIKDENPDFLACAFDSKEKTFRHEMYPQYKAQRPEMPQELKTQLPHLWEILEGMNIPVLKKPGVEADDIIGTLAIRAEKKGLDTYIVSGDKDFMQLISEHIFLYAPGTRKTPKPIIFTPEKVIEKWGVYPDKFIDFLGLMGDASDNVPGVAGVGEKTAVKLLQTYGSLENALENSDKVSNKRVKKGLEDGVENALLSKKLVTILTSVELNCKVHDFERIDMDISGISQKFSELEFHALIKQIPYYHKSDLKAEKNKEKDYKTVLDIRLLDQLVKVLINCDVCSFDLETNSLNPINTKIVGLSFATKPDSAWYIPILYYGKEKENFGDDDITVVLNILQPILESNTIKKTGQNIKFDSLVMKHHNIALKGIVFDTMIAAHLLNPGARSYNLESLSLEYLNYEMMPIEELIGKGRNQITMDEVPLEQASFYAAEDADITLQLTKLFNRRLEKEGLLTFFNNIEIPLIPILVDMEFDGVFVDSEFLRDMSNEISKKIDIILADIYKIAGIEFNVNSTQQLAGILFDKLGLPLIKKRSTAEEVLKQLQKEHELPGIILEYRKYNKIKNTYVDSLQELIHPGTKRIHSTFHQTIAATGRLSSTNPNFQNIPIRTEEGREIRKAICAQKKGWKILSADYSQVELRIMAHLSQDKALCDAFKLGDDIHARTASNVFCVSIDNVLPEMRRIAKVVNFGIMYGAGPFRMSQELDIPRSDAAAIVKSYFEQYSGIRSYIDTTLEKVRIEKYVETIHGRRRPIWDADSKNALRRQAAERIAINMPIQGSAAEMIKLAMTEIHKKISKSKMEAKMILQIHDELIFEFPNSEEKALVKLVTSEMEKALPLSIPIEVDYGIGDNWYEAH